ncbi:MAG: SH3 domain-containing protein [Saccharofermentanales bacterium]|jgi:uncharacterized protein YgiM (DUF1202 family)/3D (Asp-Asp-Asp) domain-containing protein|nr:SH3 domain-containing protein [Bacillota bacterium]
MLKTKLDKLLFAVATLLCIIVAAVFVSDRLKQQAPVRDFERIPARSVSDEMIITPELEGRKDTPLDENNASDLPAVEIPTEETTVVTTSAIQPADTQSDISASETNSNPAVAAVSSVWKSCDLTRYTIVNTRLRAQASAESDQGIIDVLPGGEKVNVISRNDSWSEVIDSKGRKGFILSELLSKTPPQSKPKTEKVNRTKYTSTELRMRKQPNTDGEYMLTIPKGEAVTELSLQGDWSLIEFSGLKGYVNNPYLTTKRPAKNSLTSTTKATTASKVQTSATTSAPTSAPTKPSATKTTVAPTEIKSTSPPESNSATNTSETNPPAEKPGVITDLGLVRPQGGFNEKSFSSSYNRAAARTNIVKIQKLINRNTGIPGRTYNNFSIDEAAGTITIDGITLKLSSTRPQESLKNTWFGHDVGEGPGDKTACGVPTQFGVIATHLWGYGDNIPFGTVMFVEGYGIGVVGDVGRLLKSDIDLCLDDYTIKDLLKARKLKNSTRRVWYIEP